MEIIFKIARKLPKPFKKPLSWLYNEFFIKIDKEMIKDLAEYCRLSEREVFWLMKRASKLNAYLWQITNPKTEEEIKSFYQSTPFYIFDLAFWHFKRSQRRLRKEIVGFAKGKILDFGGGIGDLSIELSKKGFPVDYAELSGKTFDFAKWLFKKRNCQIKMINLNKEKISKKYDTIICIDVIEHIPNPKKILKDLIFHLRRGGVLMMTGLEPVRNSKRHPMHFKINFEPEKYLNSLGLIKGNKSWLWLKK